MKPSRRIPKAFQRQASPLSRHIARKHARRITEPCFRKYFAKIARSGRKTARLASVSLRSLRLWLVAFLATIACTGIAFMLFSPVFSITSIRVSREDMRVDIEEIQKLLAPSFHKNIFLISPPLIERLIEEEYPEIADASVRRNLFHELHVTLSMNPISAIVRVGDPDGTEKDFQNDAAIHEDDKKSGLYQYLTNEGVFLEYPYAIEEKEGEDRMNIFIVDWAVKPAHRKQMISPAMLEEMKTARRILGDSFAHTTSSITLYLRAREFHLSTERSVLWFDLTSPVLTQISRYRKFLAILESDTLEEYVDLRLHDRVVYR